MTREASQSRPDGDGCDPDDETCDAPLMLQQGTVVASRFRIVRALGAGAMGVVYLAERTNGDGPVALKLVRASDAGSSALRARLRREAIMLSMIHHPNVVRLLEHGSAGELGPYVASEYLDGESLAARLSIAKQLAPDLAVCFAEDILQGLDATHCAGIVHRDLKPGNILIVKCADAAGVERERAKILDFGVSRLENTHDSEEFPTITRTGAIVGTPAFMAPEQAIGDPAQDHRVDLYSLGVLLYKMLSGALPHAGRNYNHALVHALTAEPTPLRETAPHIDAELCAIVHRAIARLPAARFATAREFGLALAHWREMLTRIDLTSPVDSIASASGFWSKPGRARPLTLTLLAAAAGLSLAIASAATNHRSARRSSVERRIAIAAHPVHPPREAPISVAAIAAVPAAPMEAPGLQPETLPEVPRSHPPRTRHRRLRLLTDDPYARSASLGRPRR